MKFIFAILPIVVLLTLLIWCKFPAVKAGAVAFLCVTFVSLFVFDIGIFGYSVALGKGIALALYVSLIITSALFLYNFVDKISAIDVIGRKLTGTIEDRLVLFLLLAWLFSAFLQGIAGFGVPVAVVAPILIKLGFDPYISVAATLLGHCWSISFGSMGSSLFALSLVTSLKIHQLAMWMGIFASSALFFTGFGVCFLYGGWNSVRKGFSYVLFGGITVSICLFTVIRIGITSLVGLISSMMAIILFLFVYKLRNGNKPFEHHTGPMTFLEAVSPYLLIVVVSISLQFVSHKISILSFHFPAYETAQGYFVPEAVGFANIKLLKHPAPIIFACSALSMVYFFFRGVFHWGSLWAITTKTMDKGITTFISLVFLVSTATVMMGSGMTEKIALDVASYSGLFYPFFAPFIGILGAFITGSNTNSNIIFGNLQESIATTLHVNPYIMCGAQSIGGGAGCAIGPTQVLLGTSAAGLQGKEAIIYKTLAVKVIFLGTLLGIINIIITFWGL